LENPRDDIRWPLPTFHFVLVRHGKSRGNTVLEAIESPDPRIRQRALEIVRASDSSAWPLEEIGILQAQSAGAWLNAHEDEFRLDGEPLPRVPFSFSLVSPFPRTQETAKHLGLANADWTIEPRIRERDWGDVDSLGGVLHRELYPEDYSVMKRDAYHWLPPNGESFESAVHGRIADVIGTIRSVKQMRALLVTHGDIRWAFRFIFEGMTPESFSEAYNGPKNRSVCGQITHYARINPETRMIEPPGVVWMRMIDPMNPDVPIMPWTRIERELPRGHHRGDPLSCAL
jgi:broad specificity phosphatase PhoE